MSPSITTDTLLRPSKTVFVDSSAFLAILSTSDINHLRAWTCWRGLLEEGRALLTNNYVIVESMAVVQKRLGLERMRDLQEKILPLLEVEWMDAERHSAAVRAVLRASQRGLSLVDCSAIETMRRLGIQIAFTFDKHFGEQGVTVIP